MIAGLAAEGATALNDAAYVALLSGDPGVRTLIILFTDGGDISSWLTPRQIVDAARRMDAVVYGVMFADRPIDQSLAAEGVLRDVPKETGGRTLMAPSAGGLASVFADILTEFRQHYILAFEPPEPVKPGWHAVTVRVKRGDAQVSARAGYFASRR